MYLQEYTNMYQQIKCAHIVLSTSNICKGCKNSKSFTCLRWFSYVVLKFQWQGKTVCCQGWKQNLFTVQQSEIKRDVFIVQRTDKRMNRMILGLSNLHWTHPYWPRVTVTIIVPLQQKAGFNIFGFSLIDDQLIKLE